MPRQSFLLLGQESLLVRCGLALLERGHEIVGIVAPEGPGASFAREYKLAHYSEIPELEPGSYDWMLSITWLQIIKEQHLAIPRRGAINFHDGPLPRHAGLLAPTWAILQGETEHAICWHQMEPQVDAGAIHIERRFEIVDTDTTLTLNAKCFEHGFDAFEQLLSDIESESLSSQPQAAEPRQLHQRWDRPPAAGQIDWSQSAVECERRFRALDFGQAANDFGRAWFRIGERVIQPLHMELVAGSSSGTAGEILLIEDACMVVACGSGAIRLSGFESPEGKALAANKDGPYLTLKAGDKLKGPSTEEAFRLEELAKKLAKHEPFWRSKLSGIEPLTAPWLPHQENPAQEHQLPGKRSPEAWIAALSISLGRLASRRSFHCGLEIVSTNDQAGLLSKLAPFAVHWSPEQSCKDHVSRITAELESLSNKGSFLRNLFSRHSELRALGAQNQSFLPVRIGSTAGIGSAAIYLNLEEDGGARLHCAEAVASEAEFKSLTSLCERYLETIATSPDTPLLEVPLLDEEQVRQMHEQALQSFAPIEGPREIVTQFKHTASLHPERVALRCHYGELSFGELDQEIEKLAKAIAGLGIGSGELVAVHLPRSLEMLIAVHAIQRAGAAYVPLDPEYPRERLAFMLSNSKSKLVLTTSSRRRDLSAGEDVQFLELDRDQKRILSLASTSDLPPPPAPEDLAYVIYTSGSTGRPKGVEIEHRSVANFFAGMDEIIGPPKNDENKVWLAVTSLSFDISVLELFWTLTRGFTVILYGATEITAAARTVSMSLAYFASDSGENPGDRYRLLREGARFADAHGFEAVWTPERHFHEFGGLYPNPSVTSAALATWTERVQLRAGSVVTGLHHPIRIAEEWSVIDNISGGRVGVALASGWHPNDFVLAPHRYEGRKERMLEDLQTIRRLWAKEEVIFENPIEEKFSVRILPEPLSPELPIWITAAGNPETFRIAGEQGCNLLTHLLGQNVEELASKVRIYREAYSNSPYAIERGGEGKVTLLLHTYVCGDEQEALQKAREPMQRYLGTAADLIKKHVSSWSAVRTSLQASEDDEELDLDKLPPEDVQALLDYAFERYAQGSALFGSPDSCLAMVERLRKIGVDEIACLIDFGVPTQEALDALPHLDQLRQKIKLSTAEPQLRESIEELIEQHGVTHFQCTPSMATMLAADETTWPALAKLECMLVGGEAVSPELARQLVSRLDGAKLLDVYGPTETTIWSSSAPLNKDLKLVPIGRPIRNNSFWILDPLSLERGQLAPMPKGVVGELWIGGEGLARGYLGQPELTQERFWPDRLSKAQPEAPERLYRTGDLARQLPDGQYSYVGRLDQQVKIRGYRVEIGEIESALNENEAVGLAAVIVEELGLADIRLVAFVSPRSGEAPQAEHLREHLRRRLPEYMVPNDFVVLPELPQTPNGKVDRRRLQEERAQWHSPSDSKTERATLPQMAADHAASTGGASHSAEDLRKMLQALWSELLGKAVTDLEANFFDLGGHSLLTIKVQSRLSKEIGRRVPLVDLFRFPTIHGLTEHLCALHSSSPSATDTGETEKSRGAKRAAKRRARRRRKN
ncbi:MAG: hypothetical protein CSA62_12545 [Planctomycetota bacterium]|nr:MAG: hypothetical protein CSA62_12545 [Planctomycetota bacterium]